MADEKPKEMITLTAEDKAEIEAWLKKQAGEDLTCTVCKKKQWVIGDHLITPTLLRTSGLWLGGPSYPSFLIVCTTCGHSMTFNAIIARLSVVQRELPPKKTDGGKDG